MGYKKAASLGVGVNGYADEALGYVDIFMTDGESPGSEDVWQFVMDTTAARRHAMRILQVCEQAEGRHGVSP